jgi:GNAT superfamily N-acetyltransferase
MSSIEYRSYEGFPSAEVIRWLVQLSEEIYETSGGAAELQDALTGRKSIHTCFAFEGDTPVAFKLGYMPRPHYFESWRGGVILAARRRGIADELQRRQHAWCKKQGFRILTTTTGNQNAPMLILNLRYGYVIVGTFYDREDHLKVILQKRIDGDG